MPSRRKNVDRLSSLPGDVITNILSFLPTKSAVRTSILSKRWRYNWTLVTNVDLNDYFHAIYGSNCGSSCFSEFVDRVLKLRKTSQLKLFRLCLVHLSVQKSDVSNWINEAIRLNVCELDLKVGAIKLPLSLFTCKTLTKLRLDVRSDDVDVFNVQSPVMLPGLKTLDISFYGKHSIYQSSVTVLKFIYGCPVLESLSFEIMSLNDEEDFNFNIPTLKRLVIRTACLYLNEVVLNLPNLEHLIVIGRSCPYFVMEDLSSLVEASVYFDGLRRDYNQMELLKGLTGVKSLSMFTSALDDFALSPLPKGPNLKHLEVKGWYRSPRSLVFQHLESFTELEHLCFEEPEESGWFEPWSIPIRMLKNLRTMEITNCKGKKRNIQFLEYMLGNAEVLKKLTIIFGRCRMKDEMEVRAKLLKVPRACGYCKIHFVGKLLNLFDD